MSLTSATVQDLFDALCAAQRDAEPRSDVLLTSDGSKVPLEESPDPIKSEQADAKSLLSEVTQLICRRNSGIHKNVEREKRWKSIAHGWMSRHAKNRDAGSDVLYDASDLSMWYNDLLARAEQELSKSTKEQIMKDLHRTWYDELNQDSMSQLSRLLQAYAIFDKSVGYCQGMNFIAAVCMHVCSDDEPGALAVMTCILHKVASGYFTPGLVGAIRDVKVTQKLIAKLLPEIGSIFSAFDTEITSWSTTDMIMCLFVHKLPLEDLLLLWDLFLELNDPHDNRILFGAVLSFFSIHKSMLIDAASTNEYDSNAAPIMDTLQLCMDRFAEECNVFDFLSETLRIASLIDPSQVAALRRDEQDAIAAEVQARSMRFRVYESHAAAGEIQKLKVVCSLRGHLCAAIDEIESTSGYPCTKSNRYNCILAGRYAVSICEDHARSIAKRLEDQEKTDLSFRDSKPWEVVDEMETRINALVTAAEAAELNLLEQTLPQQNRHGKQGKETRNQLSLMAKSAFKLGKRGAEGLIAKLDKIGKQKTDSESSAADSVTKKRTKYVSVEARLLSGAINEDIAIRQLISKVSKAKNAATRGLLETKNETLSCSAASQQVGGNVNAPPESVILPVAEFERSLITLIKSVPASQFADPLCRQMHNETCLVVKSNASLTSLDITGCRRHVAAMLELSKLQQELDSCCVLPLVLSEEELHVFQSTLKSLHMQLQNWLSSVMNVRQFRKWDEKFKLVLQRWNEQEPCGLLLANKQQKGLAQKVSGKAIDFAVMRNLGHCLFQIASHIVGAPGVRITTLVECVGQIETTYFRMWQKDERIRKKIDACLNVVAAADRILNKLEQGTQNQGNHMCEHKNATHARVVHSEPSRTVYAPAAPNVAGKNVLTAPVVKTKVVTAPLVGMGFASHVKALTSSLQELRLAEVSTASLGGHEWRAKLEGLLRTTIKRVEDALSRHRAPNSH